MYFHGSADQERGPVASSGRRFLRWARVQMSDHPVFLPVVLRCTPRGTSRRITDRTDVVIEGFPRSSNTFAAAALHVASEGSLTIASHVHTASQVVLATRRHLPTLVVIRDPVPTLCSLLVASPHVRPGSALQEWIHHYRLLWDLRDRFVTATFGQTTTDFGAVTARLNDRFGTDFPCFAHSEDSLAEVERHMQANHDRFHPGDQSSAPWPIAQRREANARIEAELRAPAHAAAVAEARNWFERYRAVAEGSAAGPLPADESAVGSLGGGC